MANRAPSVVRALVRDRQALMAYCGSFSKVLFTGIRVGWIVAPRACIEQLLALRHFSELMPTMVPHAALHELCERGFYGLHISRMHRVYRRRMQAALRALRQHLDPAWIRLSISLLDEAQIEEGVRRLAAALAKLHTTV